MNNYGKNHHQFFLIPSKDVSTTVLKAPNTACTRPLDEHQDCRGGTLRVRVFKHVLWLEVGSVKMALSRHAHQYPQGA
jgi:hypothetical protein